MSGPDELLARLRTQLSIAPNVDEHCGCPACTVYREVTALAARCETARADALEEAAKVCMDQRSIYESGNATYEMGACLICADVIRALASQAEGERG